MYTYMWSCIRCYFACWYVSHIFMCVNRVNVVMISVQCVHVSLYFVIWLLAYVLNVYVCMYFLYILNGLICVYIFATCSSYVYNMFSITMLYDESMPYLFNARRVWLKRV